MMGTEELNMWLVGILGVIGTLLSAFVPIVYHRWTEKPVQEVKYAYIKVLHLRRRKPGCPPVYRRFIKRLNQQIDVYDEVMLFRYEMFPRKKQNYNTVDRSSGIVDLQVLHPWQEELEFPDKGAKGVPGVIAPVISQTSHTYFTAAHYFNGFQEGNEDFAIKMTQDTGEARLIVDFSSLPGFQSIIKNLPAGYLRCPGGEERLDLREINPGVYQLLGKNLQKDEVLRMDFTIDWDKVDLLTPLMEGSAV